MICFQEKLMACDDGPVNTKIMNLAGTMNQLSTHYMHTKQGKAFSSCVPLTSRQAASNQDLTATADQYKHHVQLV